MIVLLIGAGLLTFLAVGGLMVLGTVAPDTKVVTGAQVSAWHRKAIREVCTLEPEEQIVLFYSTGVLSVRGEGNLLTDRAVYSWSKDERGKVIVKRVAFDQIIHVDADYGKNWLDDTIIAVTTIDEEIVYLVASTEAGGDRKFHERIVEEWKRARGARQPAAPSD